MVRLPIVASSPNVTRDAFQRRVDYLRLSLTDRCNLRCTYCMPAEGIALGPRHQLLSFEEIWRVARVARDIGFGKFRITGGEPLVVRDIVEFVRGLRQAVGTATLAMTTNAVRLAPLAHALRAAGLQWINISCDTLRPERFAAMARRQHLTDVLAGIDMALQVGFERVKINTVVLPGVNDDELIDLAALAIHHPVQVRFIEAMPQMGAAHTYVDADTMLERLRQVYDLRQVAPENASQSARLVYTASTWAGSLAFIAPLSHKFCDHCNRLRLTPYGELKGCLLTPGGTDVRTAIRGGMSDSGLQDLLAQASMRKPWSYDDARYGLDRSMSAIGG